MTARGIAPSVRKDRAGLGICLMLVAYLVFSFIDTGVKWLAVLGLPALQLAFMRYAAHFVISLGMVLKSGAGWQSFASEKTGLTILRASMIALSTVLNFFAIQYIPLTLTSTILFLSPIVVCALSWPLLGERVGWARMIAILVGFAGVVIAIRPGGADFHWAVFLSLGAAFSFAMYQILTRKLSGVVATDTMQFYTGAFGAIVLAPPAFLLWQNPQTVQDWIILFALGVFGFVGHELLTRAYNFAPAYKLSPFAYSFMLYVTLWSFLFFDHLPDSWTIVGAMIVIGAGLFIWMRERRFASASA